MRHDEPGRGYGLPIAEALELGVPAVVSDLEIFREVAGDGALFVPATDAHAFADAVQTLDDANVRDRVVDAGSPTSRGSTGIDPPTLSWTRSRVFPRGADAAALAASAPVSGSRVGSTGVR